MGKFIDLTQQRFGRLVVVERAGATKHKSALWLCRCDCGQTVLLSSNVLRTNHTRSCGCLKLDVATEQRTTHGQSKSITYSSWEHMIRRCRNQNDKRYADYGGRGITVCDRWLDFENFLTDMGERPSAAHSLDRIDSNGSYCSENCRWATNKQQQRNLRSNRHVTVGGETLTVAEAIENLGISGDAVRTRLRRGWSEQDALNRPVASKGSAR